MQMLVRTCECPLPANIQIVFQLDVFVIQDTNTYRCRSCHSSHGLLAGRIDELKKYDRNSIVQMASKSSRNTLLNFVAFAKEMKHTGNTQIDWIEVSVPKVVMILDCLMRTSAQYTTEEGLIDPINGNELGEILAKKSHTWANLFSETSQGSCGKLLAVTTSDGEDVVLQQQFITFGYVTDSADNTGPQLCIQPVSNPP